ncbi:MAG: TonB-dependent receptor plug domain-containing protein, partial [Bacteroidota bacterium]|nr:TonB-dependent receptor plug domain-containing protein [Bacteroidota bacterium]
NDNAKALEFSFVGMIKKVIPIGASNVMNVVLESEMMDIEGVVVTALGISRDKKTLGYAVQDVKGDDLSRSNEGNIVNSLSGKVAGVQVTNSSGAVGSSSRITIRGNSSFGNNQPLFVVDGTPISNASSSVSQWGGTDFGNAAADIDPENIASVSILKGANAAALYGSRAANGVVLITTKKGKSSKKGLGVTFSSSIDFSNVSILPDYQNKYGQGSIGSEYYYKLAQNDEDDPFTGSYNEYAVANAFSYGDGAGLGVRDYVDESWGPRLDIGLQIPQYTSPWLDASGAVTTDPTKFDRYQATPWNSHPDNVENFFETGVAQSYNVALSSSSEAGSARLSISNSSQKGTIPNTDLSKTSVNFSSSLNLSEKLTASFAGTYVKNSSDNLPSGGYDATNVMQSIGGWFGRQVDMDALESHWDELDPFGKPYTWSYYYHDNPYWTVNRKTTSRDRDRFFGNFKLNYELNDWMSLSARAGTDFYAERRKFTRFEMSNANKHNGGDFWQSERTNQETNIDVFLQFDKKLNDEIRIDGVIGANYRNYQYNFSSLEATELTVPNFFDVSNVSGSPTTDMYKEEKETNSVFGEVNLSYKDFLFFGATARNDW